MGVNAPFPWFGGKRSVVDCVWSRLGRPKHYIEPFCGSAAMLLAASEPASLEVVNDVNGFVANFWRATQHQPDDVAMWATYPVSHVDLGARHRWLMEHRGDLAGLQEADWPGDAKIAGWWLWGQCCWIGSGWCDWVGQIPHVSDAGMGVQAVGQIPHVGNAGRGPSAEVAYKWLTSLSRRLERVRLIHGEWDRCLNSHYGGTDTAVFLDPPYRAYESVYTAIGVADKVESWARDHADLRVALCGHIGDYSLPDEWSIKQWDRGRFTYNGSKTTNKEAIWFSPACLSCDQPNLWGAA